MSWGHNLCIRAFFSHLLGGFTAQVLRFETDGLSDNVFPHEMAEICCPDPEVDPSDDAQVQSMADRLIIHARESMATKSRVSPFERALRYLLSWCELSHASNPPQNGQCERACFSQAAYVLFFNQSPWMCSDWRLFIQKPDELSGSLLFVFDALLRLNLQRYGRSRPSSRDSS